MLISLISLFFQAYLAATTCFAVSSHIVDIVNLHDCNRLVCNSVALGNSDRCWTPHTSAPSNVIPAIGGVQLQRSYV